MNHLLHLYLVDPHPDALLGALFGDFVKGRPGPHLRKGIRDGIAHHRCLDRFAETSPAFRRSKHRLNPKLRHCRGIIIDVAYDHFLAQNWETYHHQRLEEFAASIYRLLESNRNVLPRGLHDILPRMLAADWLVSLRKLEHIESILQRLASRLSRPNLLGTGKQEIMRCHRGLESDFTAFMIEARSFFQPGPFQTSLPQT